MAKEVKASSPLGSVTRSSSESNGQWQVGLESRPRLTAQALAKAQRDISVSEFFAKNRHLLGFDNPRKALLTTVKEAVDNALDACEEAGILPEVWVKIEEVGPNRFRVAVQDNGPGILKKQIPLIFGKLLYGSKFHRLRMSRGQQGIGISAAGMYGLLTTGKPVSIISKTGPDKPAHYYEVQIDTKRNVPQILNGGGEGVDIPPGDAGARWMARHGIEWIDVPHGTRVTIELEARFQRGRGSVDEYLEMTAIANPHVTLHYRDPAGIEKTYARATDQLPPEPKEIKPHPYGVELGTLVSMLKESPCGTVQQFLTSSFCRVSPSIARRICELAGISTRAKPGRLSGEEAEALYRAIQQTKIPAPTTDCVVPIGERLILEGLRQVVRAEFYAAATRPPAVYRGNPFVIEVGLAYGGGPTVQKISREALEELLAESDARTLRQFLITQFDGLGPVGADRMIQEARLKRRMNPTKLSAAEIDRLHHALSTVNLQEGQTMTVLRFANRVPLQFQAGACVITQTIAQMNWRTYGLSQTKGALPTGPVTVMVHMASVWVPFTSESKEAIAAYPEIQREIRLALQAVGRKLKTYLLRRQRVHHEGQRRSIFLRYLGEVADAVSSIRPVDQEKLLEKLVAIARRKTAEADLKLDEHGQLIDPEEFNDGSVLIVENADSAQKAEPLAAGSGKIAVTG
jgi:DNA topoisomerase-6 subunit B